MKPLAKDDALLRNYDTIFKEHLQERVIEKACNIASEGCVHYLPHQHIIGNELETSKLRMVFDALGKFKNEKFLNDVLDPRSNCFSKLSGKNPWWSPILSGIPGLPTLLKWVLMEVFVLLYYIICQRRLYRKRT